MAPFVGPDREALLARRFLRPTRVLVEAPSKEDVIAAIRAMKWTFSG